MKQRIFKVISILFLLFFLLLFYFFLSHTVHFYIPCPFKKITGFYCPGCGITRCLFYIIQFDFSKAFWMNPLVFCFLPFILLYFGYKIYLYITNRKDTIICKIPNFIWYFLIFITLLFGVLRNIPAFSFLAPH